MNQKLNAEILNPYLKNGLLNVDLISNQLMWRLGGVGLNVASFNLNYGPKRVFQLIRASSPTIRPERKVVALGGSLHSNELAGVFKWLQRGGEIVEYAREKDVDLIVYPLRNPSGLSLIGSYPDYSVNHRYNILEDLGNGGKRNSDFLRYKKLDGTITDDLGSESEFQKWCWPWEVQGTRLPVETEKMCRLVKEKDLASGARIWGVVDDHQDLISQENGEFMGPAFYFYSHNRDSSVFEEAVSRTKRLGIRILKNFAIDAGYGPGNAVQSDNRGMVYRLDGSWPDLMSKNGAIFAVTPETTGAVPLELAIEINVLWSKYVIDLVASS